VSDYYASRGHQWNLCALVFDGEDVSVCLRREAQAADRTGWPVGKSAGLTRVRAISDLERGSSWRTVDQQIAFGEFQ
jgi:hypothetical protein